MTTDTQHQVRLFYGSEQIEFSCREGQSIVRAAQLAGYELNVGCLQGRCRTCRAKIKQGKVVSTRPLSRYATFDPAAMDGGYILLCSVTALDDVSAEPASCWAIPEPELQNSDEQ